MRAGVWLVVSASLAGCGPGEVGACRWGFTRDADGNCVPSVDVPEDDTGDAPVDTAVDRGTVAPWEDPAFWTTPGPLAALVSPAELHDPLWVVRVATSPDLERWTPRAEIPLVDVNSLDVIALDEGLVLMGLIGSNTFRVPMSEVFAFATRDLETWSTHAWPIGARRSINPVDPSLHVRRDGTVEMLYYGCDSFGIDPVEVAGEHAIRRATWTDAGWVEDATDIARIERAVDPVACNLEGEEWLFATQSGMRILGGRRVDDGSFAMDEGVTWERASVPFCRELPAGSGGGLELIGQTDSGYGLPARSLVTQDGSHTFVADLYETSPWGAELCTSPVVAPFDGGYVLFCAILADSEGALHGTVFENSGP